MRKDDQDDAEGTDQKVPGRLRKITPLEAMRDLGIMRLGARIWEMIRAGEPIIRETEVSQNRYGQTTRYARYRRAA